MDSIWDRIIAEEKRDAEKLAKAIVSQSICNGLLQSICKIDSTAAGEFYSILNQIDKLCQTIASTPVAKQKTTDIIESLKSCILELKEFTDYVSGATYDFFEETIKM